MGQALSAACILVGQVITRESELRMIWEGGPDQGASLHAAVASLQKALS
jgi:DNA-binding SARP family transcriptional activator